MAKKTTAVGKTAKAGKTAAPTRQKLQSEISSLRHRLSSSKHSSRRAATSKSSKHTTRRRTWSPDEDVAMCSARAVAECLRIASGRPVAAAAVLDLYWSAADDADSGLSIRDALEAAVRGGVGGWAPEGWGQILGQCHEAGGPSQCPIQCAAALDEPAACLYAPFPVVHPLILGLALPYGEPHAVVAHDGTWWSWGEPYSPADFPGAVVEECWAVTW